MNFLKNMSVCSPFRVYPLLTMHSTHDSNPVSAHDAFFSHRRIHICTPPSAIFENYVAEIRLDGMAIQLALWDTAYVSSFVCFCISTSHSSSLSLGGVYAAPLFHLPMIPQPSRCCDVYPFRAFFLAPSAPSE